MFCFNFVVFLLPSMTINDFTPLYSKMIGMAIYHGASGIEAEDIVQELFCKLTEIERKEGHLDRISFKGKPNLGYIFNAVRNRYFTLKRKSRHVAPDADLPEITTNPKSCTEIDVDHCLGKMHHYHRKLFKVYTSENHSLRSMSKATGISVSTLFYELKFIKESLKQYLRDPI